jgi:hypothetical protein
MKMLDFMKYISGCCLKSVQLIAVFVLANRAILPKRGGERYIPNVIVFRLLTSPSVAGGGRNEPCRCPPASRHWCFPQALRLAPEAAANWIEQLPAGPVRESAIGNYVEAAEREQRVEPCFAVWLAWNPDAAKPWLQGADFSEAVKNRWLSEKPEF